MSKQVYKPRIFYRYINLFDLMSKICYSGRNPNHLGNMSFNSLLPKSRTTNYLQLIRVCGTFPSSLFPSNLMTLSWFPILKVILIVPLRILLLKSITEGSLLSPKHSGIVPSKLLEHKSSTCSVFRLQTVEAIFPVISFN